MSNVDQALQIMSDYWDAAYCEGSTGINQSANANDCLHRMRQLLQAHAGEVVAPSAWMRKWYADGIRNPKRKDGVRGWMLRSITENQLQDDDVPLYTAPPRVVWFDGKSPPKENGLPVLCKVEFDEGYFFDVGEYDDDHWITPSLEKPTVFTNARVVSWTYLEPITTGQES